jgi:hypothetical protein
VFLMKEVTTMNVMRNVSIAIALLLAVTSLAQAQPGVLTKEQLIEYTPDWKGERFADGRPKVPDTILDRMKSVTLEEAWAVVTGAAFLHQGRVNAWPVDMLQPRDVLRPS